MALPLIAQCRADIAAAWDHVEAGRRILANSAWLLKRWAQQARAPDLVLAVHRPMGGDFVAVEETPRQRLKFKRRLRSRLMTPARLDAAAGNFSRRPPSHSPPPSGSG